MKLILASSGEHALFAVVAGDGRTCLASVWHRDVLAKVLATPELLSVGGVMLDLADLPAWADGAVAGGFSSPNLEDPVARLLAGVES